MVTVSPFVSRWWRSSSSLSRKSKKHSILSGACSSPARRITKDTRPAPHAPRHTEHQSARRGQEPPHPRHGSHRPRAARAIAADVADRLGTDRTVVGEGTDRPIPATWTRLGHGKPRCCEVAIPLIYL